MRYILDDDGFVFDLFFGCYGDNCTEYTGDVPTGYETLDEWAETANVNAYKLVNGNLTLDAVRLAEIESEERQQEEQNRLITAQELYNVLSISKEVDNQEFTATTTGNNLVSLLNAGEYTIPKITLKKCAVWSDLANLTWASQEGNTWETIGSPNISNKVEFVTTNKNILPNEVETITANGVTLTTQGDGTLILDGTATSDTEISISGSSDSTEMLFMLKAGINYIKSGLTNVTLKLYEYDGTDRNMISSGSSGALTVNELTRITQATIYIASGATFDNAIISPQIEVGTVATEFTPNKRNYMSIDVEMDNGDTLIYTDGKFKKNNKTVGYVSGIKTHGSNTLLMISINCNSTIVYNLPSVLDEMRTATITADRINLNGYISNDDESFHIDEQGNVAMNNATATNLIVNNGTGFSVTEDGKIITRGSKTFYKSNYSSSDATRASNIVSKAITPTDADYEKLDLNCDGRITIGDVTKINLLVNGNYGSYVKSNWEFTIDPTTKSALSAKTTTVAQNGSLNYTETPLKIYAGGMALGENREALFSREGIDVQTVYANTVSATTVIQTSLAERKKDFERVGAGSLDLVKNSDIYKYRFKSEADDAKKHFGFVIGEGYNTPNEVVAQNGQGIDTYSMTAILWQAVQEMAQEIEILKNNKGENNE